MGFFKKKSKTLQGCDSLDDMAKFLAENNTISVPKNNNHNTFADPLDKLIDGDLPFGWVYHHRTFTELIEKEYNYFLNLWVDARNKSPKELYSALKSFVLYMEDVEKICKEKGECFEFWFNEILTGKGYLKKRKQELDILSATLSKTQSEYEKKQKLLSNIDTVLFDFLISHNGILQKDLYTHFDSSIKSDIQTLLYEWDKSGKIKREKLGNTYKILL